MRKLLEVIKKPNGLTEFRVDGRHVLFLNEPKFERVRQAAYEYVWARPTYMWSIRGVVE